MYLTDIEYFLCFFAQADVSGKAEPLEFLPTAITDLLLTLLSQPSDTSVKTACQLLKVRYNSTVHKYYTANT